MKTTSFCSLWWQSTKLEGCDILAFKFTVVQWHLVEKISHHLLKMVRILLMHFSRIEMYMSLLLCIVEIQIQLSVICDYSVIFSVVMTSMANEIFTPILYSAL